MLTVFFKKDNLGLEQCILLLHKQKLYNNLYSLIFILEAQIIYIISNLDHFFCCQIIYLNTYLSFEFIYYHFYFNLFLNFHFFNYFHLIMFI
jgi:hypothetical protein